MKEQQIVIDNAIRHMQNANIISYRDSMYSDKRELLENILRNLCQQAVDLSKKPVDNPRKEHPEWD